MTRYGMVINRHRCIGCQACSLGCKGQNGIPSGILWNRVIVEGADVIDGTVGTYPQVSRHYLPIMCQHCENPACLKVCPTGATYKDDKGRVQVNYDNCIGCRMCMAACPYNARSFNWEDPVRDPDFAYGDKEVPVRMKGVVEKCTFCKERTDKGIEPMCVVVCPFEARTFGDLDDPDSEVSRLIREKSAYAMLEDKGTKPQVYYLD